MQSRISELFGGRVEIGSSKVSLIDATISLSDLTIHSANSRLGSNDSSLSSFKIKDAAFKFNWNSLLYRNLKVENFLASQVHWRLVDPSREVIPTADESNLPKTTSQFDENEALDISIDAIVQPIKQRIIEEAAKQNRVHQSVSSRIKSVSERLAEAMPNDGSLNVLRQRYVVEDANKELAIIKQSIAEARIARYESDKVMNSLRQSAQKKLAQSLEALPDLGSLKANQSALQLAKNAVAQEWNRNRPIVQAAMQSLTALQQIPTIPQNSDAEANPFGPRNSRLELLARIPVGLTRIDAGKVSGTIDLPDVFLKPTEVTSGFELQFKNLSSRASASRDSSDREKAAITISLKHSTVQHEVPWLICSAQQVVLPQSDTTQIQVVLERTQSGRPKTVTSIQHANQGWAASFSLPIQHCFQSSPNEAPSIDTVTLSQKTNIVGKMIGTTTANGDEPNELLIDIDESSLAAVEAILAPKFRQDYEKRRSQASIRSTELLTSEMLEISKRWDQLADEHARTHVSWEASLAELSGQLESLETAFKRTSRASIGTAR
jgi:hypothetical protein